MFAAVGVDTPIVVNNCVLCTRPADILLLDVPELCCVCVVGP